MKKLSELSLTVNGTPVVIDPINTLTLRDSQGNYLYYTASQISVEVSEGSESGNMDIVKQYIDDLRHVSGLKRDNP